MRAQSLCLLVVLGAGAPLAAAGCARGCARDRPYAPYAIDGGDGLLAAGSSSAQPGASAVAADDAGDAGGFVHVLAERAPEPLSGTWDLAGMHLNAPRGATFVAGLAADLDGDAESDVIAWVTAGTGAPGQLVFFKGAQGQGAPPPRLIAALPPILADGAGCNVDRRLEQIGKHTVSVRIASACAAKPIPGAKQQWIAVASLTSEPPLRQTIVLGAPRDGEQLTAEVDGSDADGDGRDDLLVSVGLEGGAPPFELAPRVSADLRWFDRPAGLSRDPGEPETSLRRASAAEQKHASKKADAPRAALAASRIAELYESFCAETPDPLVTLSTGPVGCPPSRAVEDAVAAQVRAYLSEGDLLRAIGAVDTIGWRSATTTRERRSEMDKWIVHAATIVTPTAVRTLRASPLLEPAPSWGPLTFEPAGPLLVRTRDGLVAASADDHDEHPVQGIPAWPGTVSAGGRGESRLSTIVDTGDGFALRARFSTGETALPVRGRAPGHAPSDDGASALQAMPVAYSTQGLFVLVGGVPVLIAPDLASAKGTAVETWATQPANAGSPRSPDGRSFAVGTRFGVLVKAPKTWELWRPPDQEGQFQELRGCTVANGARAVACVRGGQVLVMGRPEPG